jgi:hypothetical protein
MKRFLIIGFLLLAFNVFAGGSIEANTQWLPAEGNAGNYIITDGINYTIVIDQVASIQLSTSMSVYVFLKGNDRPMVIIFSTEDQTKKFMDEISRRMIAIQTQKVK